MILIILFSIFVIVTSQNPAQTSCSELERSLKSMCPGHAGNVLNRTQVQEMISKAVEKFVKNDFQRNMVLGNRLDDLERQSVLIVNSTELLPVIYEGKRYWIESLVTGIKCDQAKDVCAANRGKPANIYSREHYEKIMGQLRILAPARDVMVAWTGMTYNERTKNVTLYDDSPAPFVHWHPHAQKSTGCIALRAMTDALSPNQHMIAVASDKSRRGIVCEK